jgi:putative SOS response-associated peptidase YedK
MCNSYRITPKKGAKGLAKRVSDAAGRLPGSLVRKSDPGIVVLADERVEVMRWGFQRSFNPSINNARSDKMESVIWAEAFRERRCVIPVSMFYEWGAGPGGRDKQAHEFMRRDGGYLWIAGIWEPEKTVGDCYTMVTTEAPPVMAPIHHRMPAVLHPEEVAEYLDAGDTWQFRPYGGEIEVQPCVSPLRKPRGGSEQAELF